MPKKTSQAFWNCRMGSRYSKIYILGEKEQHDTEGFSAKLEFFFPGENIERFTWVKYVPFSVIFNKVPFVILRTPRKWEKVLLRNRKVYSLDAKENPVDGWEWFRLLNEVNNDTADIRKAGNKFLEYLGLIENPAYNKCYVFATGPSLEKAIEHDWSDGYRVVCNTIVRDKELWDHIDPHFVVAGDAIYHFGHTEFAQAFRRDLLRRLKGGKAKFVYPALFDPIVQRELAEVSEQLIPIQQGTYKEVGVDLTQHFELPGLGNVLNLLLLPLATTLSKEICLWGFDGRAPDDKLFWSNSKKHSYPELMPSLLECHSAFFERFVPADKPDSYVKSVQGDELDEMLSRAEAKGFRFVMMHKSWTDALNKRFVG